MDTAKDEHIFIPMLPVDQFDHPTID